jgi:hypothetical protein
MNVQLLLKVADAISKHPSEFNMDGWVYKPAEKTCFSSKAVIPSYGSACCLGGWAACLFNLEVCPEVQLTFTEGEIALGLTPEQEDELFYATHWPNKYYNRYRDACGDTQRASAAVEMIHDFIDRQATKKEKQAANFYKVMETA